MSETSPTRLTVYLSAELHAAIVRDAEARGQTLSVWIRRAAEAALKLSERA